MVVEVGHEQLLECRWKFDFGPFPRLVAGHKVSVAYVTVVQLLVESSSLAQKVCRAVQKLNIDHHFPSTCNQRKTLLHHWVRFQLLLHSVVGHAQHSVNDVHKAICRGNIRLNESRIDTGTFYGDRLVAVLAGQHVEVQ